MPHLSTVEEVLSDFKISRTLLWRLRQQEGFPAPIRVGERRILFDTGAIRAWLEIQSAPQAANDPAPPEYRRDLNPTPSANDGSAQA